MDISMRFWGGGGHLSILDLGGGVFFKQMRHVADCGTDELSN